jgi:phosphoglucomutase/phosphomannomutase
MTAVIPALTGDRFQQVQVYGPHAEPSGDFPNVPGHVANPENPEVFQSMIQQAQKAGGDLILATDPDCDRVGCAAPLTQDSSGPWRTFTGNQIASLLTQFVLGKLSQEDRLTPDHYVVKTLVTTELVRKIADHFRVHTIGDLHVGFKWIAGAMDRYGPAHFVIGTEESHGYLVGDYARDKDAAVAAMLLAELAAELRNQQRTMHAQLDGLFQQFGYHAERLINLQMPGSDGMARMQSLMRGLRQQMPRKFAGLPVVQMRDYDQRVLQLPDGSRQELAGPQGDLLFLDFDRQGNGVAVRPSGTEPKIKFYLFAVASAGSGDLAATRRETDDRLEAMSRAIRDYATGGGQ